MGVVGVEKVGSHFQASSSGTLVKPGNELRGGEAGLAGHGHVSASVLNKVWCESRARCPKPMMPQAMELYCDDELLPSSGVTLKECGIVDGSTVVVLYHSSDAVHYKDRPLDEHAAAGGDGSQGPLAGMPRRTTTSMPRRTTRTRLARPSHAVATLLLDKNARAWLMMLIMRALWSGSIWIAPFRLTRRPL